MFIGHHAVGLACKRATPRMSLGTLVAAAMFLDLVWPVMLILGLEHVRVRPGGHAFLTLDFYDYPWTHSMLTSAGWAIAFGLVYFAVTRYGRGAVISGLAVFSHWVLDFLTHVPDLPLWPGGPEVGLSLWRSTAGTIVVELLLFAIGLFFYVRTTRARDRIGSVGFISYVVFLLAIYAASITSRPPDDTKVIGMAGLASFLFPLWAWWFDRHRDVRA